MPVIDWIGKKEVLSAVRGAVRLLRGVCGLSAGDDEAGNLLVQGDNLEALRTLLPHYGGRVKCVYIDPPYNTGNEKWKYNDRADSPQIRRWLTETLDGKGGFVKSSDLCRHSKWLCMMYPRLRLLHEFLREDGVIFVSIDDNEVHRLRMLMDEIFGENNFYATVNWTARNKPMNAGVAKFKFQKSEEYVLVYGKNSMASHPPFNIKKGGEKIYPFRDKSGMEYREEEIQQRKNIGIKRSDKMVFAIADIRPQDGYRWTIGEDTSLELIETKRAVVKNGKVYRIFYKHEEENFASQPIWTNFGEFCGSSESGRKLLDSMVPGNGLETVKPVELVEKLLFHFSEKDSIVMDSFAGSGTTAHAVLKLNKEDGGDRKFILVEMEEDIARNITAKRIQKAVKGYKLKGKSKDKVVAPLGGGFRFCTLGPPLYDNNGHINKEVRFADLAAHIFFSETSMPIPKRATTPLLGVCEGRAIYLLYNGIMGDKSKNGGNVLTPSVLRQLPAAPRGKTRMIFGEACLLSSSRLARDNIVFRQIPHEIERGEE